MAFTFPSIPVTRSHISTTIPRATSKRRRRRAKSLVARPRAQTGYIPDDDDRAESSNDMPTKLTLSQQLLMKQYEEQVERMSPEECRKLAVEIARQMMVKDNILRKMLKKDVNFGVEPPDPDDLQPPPQKAAQ